jgi:DoxX-like family
MTTHAVETADYAVPDAASAPASRPALWLRRALSGLIIRLVPWPGVTQTMARMGYGSSESLAPCLRAISLLCTVLYAVPPTGFVGAILFAGYLGGAMASHTSIGCPLFTDILCGSYLAIVVCGGLWLRARRSRLVATSTR